MHRHLGQSLVELLLAIAVFTIGASTLAALVFGGATTQRSAAERVKALAYAKEGIEAVRSIRDSSYGNLTGGSHGLAVSGGRWGFSGASDTFEGLSRTISVNTSTTDFAYVTSTVSWSFTPRVTETVTLSTLFTNWQKTVITGNWGNPVIAATTTLPTNISANAVDVEGNRLYIVSPVNANGPEFFVYDISSPTAPALLGSLELGTTGNMLDASGNRAYVATDANQHEILILDVSSSTAPTQVGTVPLTGSANLNSVVASGTTIYFVRDRQGSQPTFFIYNTAVPAQPVLLGSLNLGDGGRDLALVPGSPPYAYFSTANNTEEFETVNINSPASLAVGGNYNAAGVEDFSAIAVSGTLAFAGSFVRSSNPEFFVLNTSNPQAPSLLGTFEVNASINRMRVRAPVSGAPSPQNNLVFLATSSSTGQFLIMNVFNPVSPSVYSRVVLPGNATGLAITTSTAYITTDNPNAGLMIVTAQ